MMTLKQAVEYLRKERGIKVTRQAVHLFVQRHSDKCQRIEGPQGKRAALWLLPTSLLDTYQPSVHHQTVGAIGGSIQKQ